jgi:hypothetical protein
MLYDETRYFWTVCQAVRFFSEGNDRKAAREAVEDLEMVGVNASSFRLFQGTVTVLQAATRASNPAARKAAAAALRNLRALAYRCQLVAVATWALPILTF